MKPKLILKSLADIPVNAVSLAASMSSRVLQASKQVLGPVASVSRRELRAASRRSAEFARDIYTRAGAPFQSITPWQRGGLNE